MNARNILGAVAVGRLLFGLWMLVSPAQVGGRWLGRGATGSESAMFVRAVGGRDVAYALGSLQAVRAGSDLKPWLGASVLVDGTDAVATLAAEGVALRTRLASAAIALSTVVISVAGALADDDA